MELCKFVIHCKQCASCSSTNSERCSRPDMPDQTLFSRLTLNVGGAETQNTCMYYHGVFGNAEPKSSMCIYSIQLCLTRNMSHLLFLICEIFILIVKILQCYDCLYTFFKSFEILLYVVATIVLFSFCNILTLPRRCWAPPWG